MFKQIKDFIPVRQAVYSSSDSQDAKTAFKEQR